MLEAETRYLPLHSELGVSPTRPFSLVPGETRPVTAPPDGRHHTTFAEVFAGRPKTADRDERNNNIRDPTYHHYQDQLNALNARRGGVPGEDAFVLPQQQAYVSQSANVQHRRLAANFLPPKVSAQDSPPQPHAKRRAASPVTRAQQLLPDDSDLDSVADDTTSTLELKLLKALIASRKNRKSVRKSAQDGSVAASHDASHYRCVTKSAVIAKLRPAPGTVSLPELLIDSTRLVCTRCGVFPFSAGLLTHRKSTAHQRASPCRPAASARRTSAISATRTPRSSTGSQRATCQTPRQTCCPPVS